MENNAEREEEKPLSPFTCILQGVEIIMSATIISAKFDDRSMWLTLSDGRMLGVPLRLFPSLQRAGLQVLLGYELSPDGIRWTDLNEYLSLKRLLSSDPLTESLS